MYFMIKDEKKKNINLKKKKKKKKKINIWRIGKELVI